MVYSYRQPPANSKYTLKICHGGEFVTGDNSYEYYARGEVTWVDNLDSKEASLIVLNNIAFELGYRGARKKYLYRSPKNGCILKITCHKDVTKLISELSVSRELEIYIVDGVKEEGELERHPTILFWNCRGLNEAAMCMLRVLVCVHDPTIIFLIETRLSSVVIGKISLSLGFQYIRDSPANRQVAEQNNCVGLAMLWKKNVKLDFSDNSDNYLDFIFNVPDNKSWRLTGFYGHPKIKKHSWEWLEKLSNESPILPWLCFGDFNEILVQEEKSGGCKKANSKMLGFRKVLEKCDLQDLSFVGKMFTWMSNGIEERLDRGLASLTWKDLFTCPKVKHFKDGTISDHIPIVIETDSQKKVLRNIKSVSAAMVDLLSFVDKVEGARGKEGLMVVSCIRRHMGDMAKVPEYYFDIAKNVAPHLIQLDYIAVHDKDANTVKYERLVTLTTCHDLRPLLLNCMVVPKPTQEYDLAIPAEFPSVSCQNTKLNLSEYLMQTWKLIKLIPTDRKITRQQIVKQKIDGQVENLIRWFAQVITPIKDEHIGSDCSNIMEILDEKAHMAGLAVIVCNTIISLFRGKRIEPEGTIIELEEKIRGDLRSYRPKNIIRWGKVINKPLDFLPDTFKWRNSENVSQYNITNNTAEIQSTEIEKTMLTAEREFMMSTDLKPLIKFIIENGCTAKEKLVELIDKRAIEEQIDLLVSIGCISHSDDDEIVLTDGDTESIVERLEKAASEAFKSLKDTSKKSMTYSAYRCKLKEAYKRRGRR